MILEHRAQSVGLRKMKHKMLPNGRWGSCHVVTEGAAMLRIAVTEGVVNSSLQNTGGIL